MFISDRNLRHKAWQQTKSIQTSANSTQQTPNRKATNCKQQLTVGHLLPLVPFAQQLCVTQCVPKCKLQPRWALDLCAPQPGASLISEPTTIFAWTYPTGALRALCLSADLVCIYLKHWLGAGKQLELCECYACQGS